MVFLKSPRLHEDIHCVSTLVYFMLLIHLKMFAPCCQVYLWVVASSRVMPCLGFRIFGWGRITYFPSKSKLISSWFNLMQKMSNNDDSVWLLISKNVSSLSSCELTVIFCTCGWAKRCWQTIAGLDKIYSESKGNDQTMPRELLLDDIKAQAVSQNVIPSYYQQYFNVTNENWLWGIS